MNSGTRVCTADRDRLTCMFTDYQHRITAYVRSRVRADHRADIDDLVQETFLEAWRSMSRGLGPADGHEIGWLLGIAHHVVAHFYRHGDRSVSPVDPTETVWVAPEPGQVVEAHETLDLVDGLIPRQRDVLRLVAVGGMTHVAAAEVLGCDRVTIRRNLRRGISELRDRMAVSA